MNLLSIVGTVQYNYDSMVIDRVQEIAEELMSKEAFLGADQCTVLQVVSCYLWG